MVEADEIAVAIIGAVNPPAEKTLGEVVTAAAERRIKSERKRTVSERSYGSVKAMVMTPNCRGSVTEGKRHGDTEVVGKLSIFQSFCSFLSGKSDIMSSFVLLQGKALSIRLCSLISRIYSAQSLCL